MKAIVDLTSEEYREQMNTHHIIKQVTAGMSHTDMFDGFAKSPGYAHYKFRGKCSAELLIKLGRLPTPDEVIMLVDGGFSHFGATCTIQPDGSFSGRVNVD